MAKPDYLTACVPFLQTSCVVRFWPSALLGWPVPFPLHPFPADTPPLRALRSAAPSQCVPPLAEFAGQGCMQSGTRDLVDPI